MAEYTLHLGDCLSYMRTLPDGCFDAVVTDPPYFLPAQHYQTRRRFTRNFSDLGILEHFFRDFFGELSRVLRPTGTFYIFCDGQSYPLFWYHAYSFTKAVRPLIWDKGVAFNGYTWRHQHEIILYGEMPEAPALPTGDGDILRSRAVPVLEREHPAEKPVSLIRKLLEKVEGIVFDPFAGSGAVGIAAMQSGLDFVGCEINPEYVTISERYIREASQQPPLFIPEPAPKPEQAGLFNA